MATATNSGASTSTSSSTSGSSNASGSGSGSVSGSGSGSGNGSGSGSTGGSSGNSGNSGMGSLNTYYGRDYGNSNIMVGPGGMVYSDDDHHLYWPDLGEDTWKPALINVELPDLPECDCGQVEMPALGAGVNTGFTAEAQALQSSLLTEVPDTQFTQYCQSNCCACE